MLEITRHHDAQLRIIFKGGGERRFLYLKGRGLQFFNTAVLKNSSCWKLLDELD